MLSSRRPLPSGSNPTRKPQEGLFLMPKLPYSRTVNVTLTRSEIFRLGEFWCSTDPDACCGCWQVGRGHRTRVYGSMEEVVVDHAANTEVYKAMEADFRRTRGRCNSRRDSSTSFPRVARRRSLRLSLMRSMSRTVSGIGSSSFAICATVRPPMALLSGSRQRTNRQFWTATMY